MTISMTFLRCMSLGGTVLAKLSALVPVARLERLPVLHVHSDFELLREYLLFGRLHLRGRLYVLFALKSRRLLSPVQP